jgi:hypothetical protein
MWGIKSAETIKSTALSCNNYGFGPIAYQKQ